MSKSVMDLMHEWERNSGDDPSVLINGTQLRLLLAAVEAAKEVAKYEPDADLEPGLAQDMPALIEALDALYADDLSATSGSV